MKITIKTKRTDFSMPVPLSMAGVAIRAIPESVFAELRQKAAEPYNQLLCRENLLFLYEECKSTLGAYKNLELIHVETRDGVFISVVL